MKPKLTLAQILRLPKLSLKKKTYRMKKVKRV